MEALALGYLAQVTVDAGNDLSSCERAAGAPSAEPTLQPCQWLLVVLLVTAVKRVTHHTKHELSPDVCQGLSSPALISLLITWF